MASGKQPAYRGVILLYFAAQLLQGFRAHSPEGNQAELRIRLTMAFLPLLGSLGDCTAKDAGTLSAGESLSPDLTQQWSLRSYSCWPPLSGMLRPVFNLVACGRVVLVKHNSLQLLRAIQLDCPLTHFFLPAFRQQRSGYVAAGLLP